jgi:hypothetical protein
MYSQKLSSLGLAVLASIVLVAPSVSSGRHQRPDRSAGTTTGTWVADGGAPVPPVPTKPPVNYTIADGGAPVPPVPLPPRKRNGSSNSQPTVLADGGAPVPPVPTKPPANYTIADGGAPVPPVPPRNPQPSIADGGAPVPPLPPGPKGQLASFVV